MNEVRDPKGPLLLLSITGHRSDRVELTDNHGKKTVRDSEQVGEKKY